MLLIERKAKLKWNPANRMRYEDLGYAFTNYRDEFEVEIKDLTLTSRAMIWVECDYCGEEKQISYKNYNDNLKKTACKKYTCGKNECRKKKTIESSLLLYGVENPNQADSVKLKKEESIKNRYGEDYTSSFQVPEIKEKIAKTNLERYGAENIFASDYAKQKIVEYNLCNYGVKYFLQTGVFLEKSIKTSREKYGTDFPSQNEEVKEKVRQTNLSKYGVPYALQNEQIRLKGIETNIKKYGVPNYTQTIEYKEKYCGENAYNYNHEKSEEERILARKYPDYEKWRKSVFERDRYTCQCCGIEGSKSKLNAHHKNGYHWYVEGRTDVNNGITLCENCHIEFHREYGREYNTEEQYIEFQNKKNKSIK